MVKASEGHASPLNLGIGPFVTVRMPILLSLAVDVKVNWLDLHHSRATQSPIVVLGHGSFAEVVGYLVLRMGKLFPYE